MLSFPSSDPRSFCLPREFLVSRDLARLSTSYLELPRKLSCCLVQVLVIDLFATGSPGGEGEVDEDGGGDVGLVDDHRAGLYDGAAQAEGLGHVVILGA